MHLWRRDDGLPGHSVARIGGTADGWTAHGVEVLGGPEPIACWFRVDLDPGWLTLRADVRSLSAAGERLLRLEADGGRRWTADGERAAQLDGCVDVDVAATPLTNTFPIRRLADLPVGESRTTPIAWVEVPSLAVRRVEQTYERLGPASWRYSDPDHGAFALEVDGDGVVTRYEGFAVRVA